MNKKDLDALKWAMAEIREKMEAGFFGDVLFRFHDGRITISEVKEQRKPPQNNN